MTTNVDVVYKRALSKMREYIFISMDDEDISDVLSTFLKSSESEFERIYGRPFLREDGRYSEELSDEVVEILASGMLCYWATSYVADSDKWMNALSTKDYTVFSPANLLKVTSATRDSFVLEFHDKMNRYSYLHGDLIRNQVR